MGMQIDQSREQRRFAQIDYVRTGWSGEIASDLADFFAFNPNDGGSQWITTAAVDQSCRFNDCDRWSGRHDSGGYLQPTHKRGRETAKPYQMLNWPFHKTNQQIAE
jgi:hypothetical protein